MSVLLLRRRSLAALVLALTATACGGGTRSTGDASRAGGGAVDPEAYRTRLDDAGDGVKKALASIRGEQDDLIARLERSAEALERDADALDVTPPKAAEAGHAGVVDGLRALAGAFSDAAEDVESGRVCTPPAALAQITRSSAAGELRSAARALRRDGFRVGELAPDKRKTPARRLANGTILGRSGDGPGQLVIRNGSAADGVVKLVAGQRRVTVYVSRDSTATVGGIADGEYRAFFASGLGWDGERNTFSRRCGFTRFEDPMRFRSPGNRYTKFTITLNPVAGGQASTSKIDPGDFPR